MCVLMRPWLLLLLVSRSSQKSFFTMLSTVVRTEAVGVGARQLAAIIVKNALFAEVWHGGSIALLCSASLCNDDVAPLCAGVAPQDEYRHEQKLARWRALDPASRTHVKNEVGGAVCTAVSRRGLTRCAALSRQLLAGLVCGEDIVRSASAQV
jgi:hypothetical protein